MFLRTPWLASPLLALLLLVAVGHPAEAQIQPREGPLPPELEERIIALLNDPSTVRLPGAARIPVGSRVDGDVAVLGGSATVGGEVAGNLLVVNGDLTFRDGARVGGDVLVVGGLIVGVEHAELAAGVASYRAPLRYRIRRGRVEGVPEEGITPGFLASDFGFGRSRITFRTDTNYNRVEGLPVKFGPIVETRGRNPLRLEAFGVWRSVSGFDLGSDVFGYSFRLEQAAGGRGTMFVGATAHSDVAAIEERGLSSVEASLSSFLLRRDLRDYYEREGWTAYLELRPGRLPLRAALAFRQEDHSFAPIRDPLTLRSRDAPWRPQILAAEGRYRGLELDLEWDSRDDPDLPADGWNAHLSLQRQVGGSLALPLEASPTTFSHFTAGSLDLRRYARVSPTTRLLLRGVASGSLTSTPLPPQFQRAPGGEGTLPGHPRFALDCGARAEAALIPDPRDETADPLPVFPLYGCDRTALAQLELQGSLPFSWNPVPAEWRDSEWSALLELQPRWALFLNAGQGWITDDLGGAFSRDDAPTRADVGVGVFVGPLGLYWSYPLNRRDRGLNFFVRLQQRF